MGVELGSGSGVDALVAAAVAVGVGSVPTVAVGAAIGLPPQSPVPESGARRSTSTPSVTVMRPLSSTSHVEIAGASASAAARSVHCHRHLSRHRWRRRRAAREPHGHRSAQAVAITTSRPSCALSTFLGAVLARIVLLGADAPCERDRLLSQVVPGGNRAGIRRVSVAFRVTPEGGRGRGVIIRRCHAGMHCRCGRGSHESRTTARIDRRFVGRFGCVVLAAAAADPPLSEREQAVAEARAGHPDVAIAELPPSTRAPAIRWSPWISRPSPSNQVMPRRRPTCSNGRAWRRRLCARR